MTCLRAPELAELASIEKLVGDAFDSVDAPVLGSRALPLCRRRNGHNLPSGRILPPECFGYSTNALGIWKACKDGAARRPRRGCTS